VTPIDPFAFAARIGEILDSLGIPYLVGGSVASMVYGETRFTRDLDLLIDADEKAVRALAAQMEGEYYIDADAAADAVRHHSTFNAIHLESLMKVDFFVPEDRAAARAQIARGRVMPAGEGMARFYAPEDIIIQKLRWFRLGGETSEQQWRDIVGVLRVKGDELDHLYLDRAAEAFEVADLLARARDDAR
jgi:hypothetical protein